MKDVYQKAEGDKGILEKIGGIIPGFGGYLNKERRRDSDKIQREFLAKALEENKAFIDELVRDSSSEPGMFQILDDLDRLKKKIDKTASKIRYASYGYSGFFDAVKVGEQELAQLHQFDLEMDNAIEEVGRVLKTLSAGSGDAAAMKQSAKTCARALDDLDRRFSDREAIIKGVK